jgi:hypothetical protein
VRTDVAAGMAEHGVVVEVLLGSAPAPLGADAHRVLHAATAAVRQAPPADAQRAA